MTLLFQFYVCDWCDGLVSGCWGEDLAIKAEKDPEALRLIYIKSNDLIMDNESLYIKFTQNLSEVLVFPKNSMPVDNSYKIDGTHFKWVETVLYNITFMDNDADTFITWTENFGRRFKMSSISNTIQSRILIRRELDIIEEAFRKK
jgi:hypothetical protein